MFRPPTDGYEENLSIFEHLIRKPSSTLIKLVKQDLALASLNVGDVVIFEQDRIPKGRGELVLADYRGASYLCLLYKKPNNKLYAVTDSRSGWVDVDEFMIKGVATFTIKNQKNDSYI